jgi:hypothetical protein
MDIEGAEFGVIEQASTDILSRIGQLVVEFHDGTVPEFTRRHREEAVRRLIACGFEALEYNGRDTLFFRPTVLRDRRAST